MQNNLQNKQNKEQFILGELNQQENIFKEIKERSLGINL
jgi:hypothetical protein